MADLKITERLQPSLLDRLTDNAPEAETEGRNERVIDVERLRDIIRRDLSWLLNTNNLETEIDAARFPHAAASVINYGLRDVSGDFATEDRAMNIRTAMQQAIERFEPRVREGTLDVVLRKEESARQTSIVFDIIAEMWAQPLPMELYLRSEVDMTTGELHLRRVG